MGLVWMWRGVSPVVCFGTSLFFEISGLLVIRGKRVGLRPLRRREMVSEEHSTNGFVYELRLVNRNDYPVSWHLAGLDDHVRDSFAKRALLFDRPSLV
jgi:hypothetical protein